MTAPEWTLYLGECIAGLASLPDRSIDVCLTDPPYSEHVHRFSRAAGRPRAAEIDPTATAISRGRDLGFDAITQAQRDAVARQLARLVRRWVLVFCDAESVSDWIGALTSAGLEHVRIGAWVKEGATPQFTGDRPAVGFEAIVIAHPPGRKRWNGGGRHGVWACPIVLNRGAGEARVHPTQKPIALMEALVRDFSDRGELILDPFAGSGTTGVAAVAHGRRFLGWERDPEYHEVARKRLAMTREQLGLFATEAV